MPYDHAAAQAARKAAALEAYNAVPEYIRYDMWEAMNWARETLRDHEGSGHHFEITADKRGALACCFAKPQWNADHCGDYYDSASEAIVSAVVTYLAGL